MSDRPNRRPRVHAERYARRSRPLPALDEAYLVEAWIAQERGEPITTFIHPDEVERALGYVPEVPTGGEAA